MIWKTSLFAERVRNFCLRLPKNVANAQYIPQLIRAGNSPGANYIEANERIGDKDFKMKIKHAGENRKSLHIGFALLLQMDRKRWRVKETM